MFGLIDRRVLCRRWLPIALSLAAFLASALGCGWSPFTDTGDVEHPDEPKMTSVTLAPGSLELFMEHPYLVAGEEAKFNVHLTVLADGMPIRSGKLVVTAVGPSGKTATTAQPAPRSPGIFGPVIAFPEAGPNEMALALVSEQANETIRVPVTVYPDDAAAQRAAAADDGAGPEGAITFLKEQAWRIGVIVEPVARHSLAERLTVPGEIVPAAGARALITTPVEGRLLPPPGGAFPRVGETVEAGRVLAVVEPPLAGPQGVQLLVNQAQIQSLETELSVKELDVEADINKAKIDMEFAGTVYQRLRSLGEQSVASQKQVDEAERQYLLAKATYDGKMELRAPYEAARQQLRSILQSGVAAGEGGKIGLQQAISPAGLRISLPSPITGTVTSAHATAGEFVDATKELFTVINLDTVWIEAKVSEYDLPQVTSAPAASFTLAAYPDRRYSILGESGGRLVDIGNVVDPGSRTVPVRYELPNPEGLLRIGLFADVGIETAQARDSLAVPESAIVDEDGRPTIYVQLDGESYQKRDVQLGIRDDGFVEIRQGLSAGERVVVKGGYAIRLASVSAVIPAHGHTH